MAPSPPTAPPPARHRPPGGGTDSASAADYDRDGFVDIYLTYNRPSTQLYQPGQQQPTGSNSTSPAPAPAATASAPGSYVTAGGGPNSRTDHGGVRYWSQNDQSVTSASRPQHATSMPIKWPSSQSQPWLTDVTADKVLPRHRALTAGPAVSSGDLQDLARPRGHQETDVSSGRARWTSSPESTA